MPALDGRTPREMARTAKGHKRLQEFLREMDFDRPEAVKEYDFNRLRRLLGVPEE